MKLSIPYEEIMNMEFHTLKKFLDIIVENVKRSNEQMTSK